MPGGAARSSEWPQRANKKPDMMNAGISQRAPFRPCSRPYAPKILFNPARSSGVSR